MGTVRYIWTVIHKNGDGEHVASVGTYSTQELAKRAGKCYIKAECEDWPLGGERLVYYNHPIDRWYLDENDLPTDTDEE